jgi:hypothetical protein
MVCRFKIFLWSIVLVSTVQASFKSTGMLKINIRQLKNISKVLPEDEKYNSPVFGLPLIENGVAENIYLFSAKQIKQRIATALQDIAEDKKVSLFASLDQIKNTHTQNLVSLLFHSVGGTFNLTNAVNNPMRLLSPKDIGGILKIIGKDLINPNSKLKKVL